MKIKKIEVLNFKAIENQELNLEGCSAIITAGNNKGKSSILSGLIERFQGIKPSIIVKKDETKGFNKIELTDGSIIEWKFTEKTESFSFTTSEGIKQTTGVIQMLGEKYFGRKFDIDKFLTSQPKKQVEELQRLVGLDFSKIDKDYQEAYDKRTDANKEVIRLRNLAKEEPIKTTKPNIEEFQKQLQLIREQNEKLLDNWREENQKLQEEIVLFNDEQKDLKNKLGKLHYQFETVSNFPEMIQFFDVKKYREYLSSLGTPQPLKEYVPTPKPELTSTQSIEETINEAQHLLRQYDSYERDLKEYNDWVEEGKAAFKKASELDKKVKSIQEEKAKMISSAKIPKEFTIVDNQIFYNDLPLIDSQVSSSGKYIAALKLGSLVLGEIKTMHFDASFLDNNSLKEIRTWAESENLQLLIERPDLEGGEIQYQILSKC